MAVGVLPCLLRVDVKKTAAIGPADPFALKLAGGVAGVAAALSGVCLQLAQLLAGVLPVERGRRARPRVVGADRGGSLFGHDLRRRDGGRVGRRSRQNAPTRLVEVARHAGVLPAVVAVRGGVEAAEAALAHPLALPPPGLRPDARSLAVGADVLPPDVAPLRLVLVVRVFVESVAVGGVADRALVG